MQFLSASRNPMRNLSAPVVIPTTRAGGVQSRESAAVPGVDDRLDSREDGEVGVLAVAPDVYTADALGAPRTLG